MPPTPPALPASAMLSSSHDRNAITSTPRSQSTRHTTRVRPLAAPEGPLPSQKDQAADIMDVNSRAHPVLDLTPSEGSGSSSINSEPRTPRGHHNFAPSSDSMFIEYGKDGELNSATLRGLVERLISGSGNFREDMEFRDTFLTSYRAFSTAENVFCLLLEHFEAVSSTEDTDVQRTNVRHSVLTVLELWLRGNHVEAKDTPLLKRMKEFAASIQASPSVSSLSRGSAHRLIQMIERKLQSPALPVTPSPSHSRPNHHPKPSETPPEVLALVLTSIEGSRYHNIIDSDFIGWLEGIDDSNEVSSFISGNKRLSYWAQKAVLRPDEQSQRAGNLKYFLSVVEECRRLRNFSSACALIGGLATSSIINLKRTRGTLDKSSVSVLKEAEKMISFEMNFKEYRAALNESKEPCIPWMYVHLHDLKIIHRANPRFVHEENHKDLINFRRYRRVHDQIRHILSYQVPPLNPTDSIRYTKIQNYAEIQDFVESTLRSLIVDDALRDWLRERGSKLAMEEKTDYDQYMPELAAAGFIKPDAVESSHGAKSSVLPISPHQDTPLPPPPETHTGAFHAKQRNGASPRIDSWGTPAEPNPKIPSAECGSNMDFSRQRLNVVMQQNYETVFDKHNIHCLDHRISLSSPHPVAGGGFADVREGFLGTQKVAIKTIRPFSSTGKRIEERRLLRRLWREYSARTKVSHPIVLPCLGFSYDFSPPPYVVPSLISPWMSNGTARAYLENYPDKNRLELLVAVAEGLAYLHDQQPAIIHGDLREANILISDSGRPCLSDFGLARILRLEAMTPSSEHAGCLRWMSPELLLDDFPSESSDVWAYGMTALEIMSGNHPYHEIENDVLVFGEIKDGRIPSRPQDTKFSSRLTDDVWAICQHCWLMTPSERPPMSDIFSKIRRIIQ